MKEQLSAIALAYEAALEPDKWPEALDMASKVAQSKGAVFCMMDANNPSRYNFNVMSGSHDTKKFMDYAETHIEFESRIWDAAVDHLRKSPEFSIVSDQQLVEQDSTLYDEQAALDFSKNLGIYGKLGVMLNNKAPWNDGLGFQYGNDHEIFPAQARANISAIAPYFSRVISIIRPAHVLKAEHGMMLDVLDKLAIGIAVVSDDGTLILKNESFNKILDLDALYLDPQARLRVYDSNLDSTLRRSMNGTSKMSVGIDLDRGEFISIPIKGRAHPVSLEVAPLGRYGKDSPSTGWSMIFAIDPYWRLVTDTRKLAQSYSLTATEKDVCSMLLKGLSNREIGDERSVGMETVKSHVSSLLAKTYTKNRTELARLAAIAELPLMD
ncbi:MAG: helix-turn-helix transcriptional regulator [Amylibacter sp.]